MLSAVLATCVVVASSVLGTIVEDSSVVNLVLATYVEGNLVVLFAVVDSSVFNTVDCACVEEAAVVLLLVLATCDVLAFVLGEMVEGLIVEDCLVVVFAAVVLCLAVMG